MSLIWSFNCLLITLYIIKVVSEGTIIYTLLSSFKFCTGREEKKLVVIYCYLKTVYLVYFICIFCGQEMGGCIFCYVYK